MANNSTPSFLEKVKSFFKALSKQQLIAIIAAVVAVAILIPVIIFVPKGNNTPEETTPATTTPAETTPEVTTPDNTPDNTPVAKDYQIVVVTDSAISNGKVSNHALALVIGADGKIVAARFDCAEIKPALDEGGELIAQDSVTTKVELGDSYSGMAAGSWADQAKAFENYIVGKTAEEVANLDLALVAGCTMKSTTPVFQALVAKAFASELKVSFSTADDITIGLAINSTVKASKGKASVASDFAGVVLADGKVVATMLDSCEQKFSIEDGALVAPETPAVSKNDQGDSYVMPAGAWYVQAQVFANSTVGKTVAELADLEVVSDALATAGCTMQNTTAGYKATIIAAAGKVASIPENTPVVKDYQIVVVTDSAISNGKVSNHALALVIGADGKIVAARFDCAEIKPALDEGGELIAQDSVTTKVELGDSYSGMAAGSWADQAKAFENYIVGKTAEEVANLDLALVAGCTMKSTTPVFQALVAKAFASELKVSFSTADDITIGLAINSTVKASKGKASVASDFAGVVLADGKVVATMLDSCEQKFSIEDGALVAPETPAVSKNDQGDSYVMPAGAWYVQAQVFANSTVGKTVAELADLEVVSDALATAGCTMQNTTAGYKTTIIAAAGYAR